MLLAPVLPDPEPDATDTPLTSVRTSALPWVVMAPDVPEPFAQEPAGIRHRDRNARQEAGQRRGVPSRRQRVDDFGVEHLLAGGVLDVDHRRLTGHRNRFFDRADAHLGVHRRGKRSGQLDAVASHGAEPGQCDGDRIRAGPQVLYPVLPRVVGDDGAHLLNQRRTGYLDGDTGQHSTGRVADDAGNGRLGIRYGRQYSQPGNGNQGDSYAARHVTSWRFYLSCDVERLYTTNSQLPTTRPASHQPIW